MKRHLFRLASPFPIFDTVTKRIIDGGHFTCSEFCRRKLDQGDAKCGSFYRGLEQAAEGVQHHICPYRFSAVSVRQGGIAAVLTSLFCSDVNGEYKARHKGTGKKHNTTAFEYVRTWLHRFERDIIPALNEHTLTIYREATGPFHDLAKVNQNIKVTSLDVLSRLAGDNLSSSELTHVRSKVETIYHATEFFTNQKLIVEAFKAGLDNLAATPRSTLIHKPFFKTAKIFESLAKKKGVRIDLGDSNAKVRVSTKYFELIPFLLIDNAVKFSSCRNNKQVQVDFEEMDGCVCVHVSSFGNAIAKEEQPKIFDLHYRSERECQTEGDGIGLFLLKSLCETNLTTVSVASQSYTDKDGCEKAKNVFTLRIPRGD